MWKVWRVQRLRLLRLLTAKTRWRYRSLTVPTGSLLSVVVAQKIIVSWVDSWGDALHHLVLLGTPSALQLAVSLPDWPG